MASAGTPQTHCPSVSGSTCSFEGTTSTLVQLTITASSSLKVTCSQTTTTGTMGTTGGSVRFLFHECKEDLFGTKCTTAGQSTEGTITTTLLPYDNIYTTANKTSPGVLVTPAAGTSHFASFSCSGTGAITVSGNGVIGSLSAPACGGTAAAVTLGFTQSVSGHQTHKQITGTGTIFDLTSNSLLGPSTAAQVGTGSASIVGGSVTLTCV